jgi:putative colanic acid biosynthesis acetyltransferase WcaF
VLEPYAWVCARAIVLPGVTVGRAAVLGAGAVAGKNLEPRGVYAGNPAKKVGERKTDGRVAFS